MSFVIDIGVAAAIEQRGVSRLTHFTNSRNLRRILDVGAILPTSELNARSLPAEKTDLERYDGQLGHVCCNIEYPNMFYFSTAAGRPNSANYSDWVVFLLDPAVAAQEGVLFAPHNAARGRGSGLVTGVDGFHGMYAPSVNGRQRSPRHNPPSPTDVQAEVLVPGSIPLSNVLGIVVPNAASLKRERGRLRQISLDPDAVSWHTSSELFQRTSVTNAVRESNTIFITGPIAVEFEGHA